MRNNHTKGEIKIYADTLVRLHKKLKKDDILKGKEIAEHRRVEFNETPPIIIDFETVTSVQEDYRDGGTVIMDAKTACMVAEPLEDVLEAWIKVKSNLNR